MNAGHYQPAGFFSCYIMIVIYTIKKTGTALLRAAPVLAARLAKTPLT
jgi:hypothetical protein